MKTFEDPLIKEEVAIKQKISNGLRYRLKRKGVTIASIARDTGTSRTAIRRVLDEKNTSITLHTIVRTANSLGYRLRLTLEPRIDRIERVEAPKEVRPLMQELGEALDKLPAH